MKLFVFTFLLGISFILCAHPHGGLTIPEVIEKLWLLADLDNSNCLSLTEFQAEFITSFDHDHSGSVAEHEFVHQWQHNYKEHHQIVVHIFQHFDMDKDGALSSTDLNNLFQRLDNNVNHCLEHNEYAALMSYLYGTAPLPELQP
ncbi:uncharacterized protein [Mytilus edulis]|uniref:uncharacterized protein n=1 Tax=Mytilus edulis TaxID=6550 RepID=UPI0039F026B7